MNFSKMKQINPATNFGRGISRKEVLESYTWEWQDDKRKWIPYDQKTSQILEDAYFSSKDLETVELSHGMFERGPYLLDFRTLKQFRITSPFKRNVRRIPLVEKKCDGLIPIEGIRKDLIQCLLTSYFFKTQLRFNSLEMKLSTFGKKRIFC